MPGVEKYLAFFLLKIWKLKYYFVFLLQKEMDNLEKLKNEDPDVYKKLLHLAVDLQMMSRRDRRKAEREIIKKAKNKQ